MGRKKVQVPVKNDPKNKDGFIEWTLKPTFAGQALRVQGYYDFKDN